MQLLDDYILSHIDIRFDGVLNWYRDGESINLADFKTYRDYVITDWTPVDLKGISNCDKIDFEITSSRADFPKYACFDSWYFNNHIEY